MRTFHTFLVIFFIFSSLKIHSFESNFGGNFLLEKEETKQENESLFFYELEKANIKGFIERRQNKFLDSFLYDGKLLYFARGYRYKPSSAFNLFRDKNFYTSKSLSQPLQKSQFLGFNYWNLQLGIFSVNQLNHFPKGLYFSLEKGNIFYGLIPSKKEVYGSINKNWNFKFQDYFFYSKVSAEKIRTKDKRYDFLYANIKNRNFLGEISSIKSKVWSQYNRQKFQPYIQNSQKISFTLENDHSVRFYSFKDQNELNLISESQFSIWKLSSKGKFYFRILDHSRKKDYQLKSYLGIGGGYEYILKNLIFSLGAYKRENQDKVVELKFFYKKEKKYIELLALVQPKSNKFKSYFEGDVYNNYLPGYLTEKTFLLKLKLSHRDFSLSFTKGNDKEKKENFSLNLEVKILLE